VIEQLGPSHLSDCLGPFELRLGKKFVMPVWEEVVQTMHLGEVARFLFSPEVRSLRSAAVQCVAATVCVVRNRKARTTRSWQRYCDGSPSAARLTRPTAITSTATGTATSTATGMRPTNPQKCRRVVQALPSAARTATST
jgi:hypothetical protein